MDKIWIIAKRELKSFFDSLTAYIMLIAFLGFSGFFTWFSSSDIFIRNQADLRVFFDIAKWTLFFFIPAITMRMLAEERRSGTIELLLTKAVSDWQIIFGKFLACLLLIAIALLFTLPYYFTVWHLGPIDHAAVWTGYLGLILMSATYISIGLFASSITNNQIVAFLLTLVFGIFFQILFEITAQSMGGVIGGLLSYLSINSHFESISRGVIDSKDLVYFGSIIFLSLILAESTLAKRNMAS